VALRLVFMGTPDFAVPTLSEITKDHEVVAVYTRAPKPGGRRGLALQPTPVASLADELHIPIFTPKTLRTVEAADAMRAHGADAAVVVAYGLILPKAILEVFPLGCFNLHASLLPRWRGAAPIHRAIMAGDRETGVAVMRMEEGLDTGPIATWQKKTTENRLAPMPVIERVSIGPDATTGELHDELMQSGAGLMGLWLMSLERGPGIVTPQPDEGVTYAAKIDKGETRIDWTKPWNDVHNHCRGLSPFPGAWFE
jgi:methionyl-tRNA formyltransferase